ncbi:dynein heavy chain domain-containing protein 1 isoform X2 [Melanotaenia boesemani]|uniref:dynein heavy chain domain-containing protein 1 isoform X2 n=1 Tax=Melanotaenia boesemani TaxID=1250792 RepID=UPI001C0502B0|nr:dynein heavy chain domain-containing protein 1 isoform X2 [Melanotaenia boesemani]
MFAAFSKERSSDGSPHTSDKDIANSKPKVEKKVNSSEVTLPPLRPEPSCFSVAKPLFSCGPILKNVPSNESLSVLELPNPFAQVGPGRAMAHAKWTGRPQLLPSAFKTAIPIRATQSKGQSLTEKEDSVKVTTCKNKKIRTDGRATKSKKHPLTGTEVVEMFAQKRDPGDLEFYYLKERDGDTYRPYDLQVISSSDAGSEHYIFSPDTVLHVTKTGFGGLVSLAEWNREYVLWTALQKIPFFRDFRPRKAFAWWQKNVHMILFNRRCKNLQDMLLLAVPQFRNALHLFTGIIEELKETHWMPLDDSKTYTLLEFRTEMIKKSQECFLILEKLAQYHAVVLNMVKDESYRTHKELQLHIKLANRPNRSYEPIHLHLAYQHELKKELHQSERILQKLGNFAALVHQMIVQSVVTIIQQDAISFLSRLKMASQQCCLFHTELCFSESSQLTMDPPVHMFQETVSECLLTAGNSVIQMCDSCGLFQEISSNAHSSVQDLISDLSCMKLSGEKNSDRRIGHSFREMSAHQLALPEATVLMVQSNMMHGSYYPLSKTQLEWQICINDITKEVEIEQAKIMQAEELEIQQLCKSYAWLGDIHLFVTQWSPVSLESMKGQPASVYEEHIKKLRSWAERINTVDASVYTSNQMFIIHCTHTKVTLGQQLNLIEQQVLHQLVEQMKLRTESLILVLEGVTAALKKEPQVLQDFSKYAFRVRETSKMLTDLEKSLEYNVSLRNTICTTYRKMTEQELTLEEKMLDLWNSFIVLLKQADSLVRQRLPLMANALETKFSLLAFELKNIVFKATSGPFLDQCQNASEIVPKLNHMCAHVQALYEELKQLNRNSESIQEQTIDLTNITADVQKVIARKDLWQLKAEYTTWVEEWKQQLFSEVVVSEALGKTFKWKKQAQILTSSIPTDDTVLQETLGVLEDLSHQTEVMVKLHSTKLREKHWEAIFQGMGLLYIPEKQVTVDEIMSQQLKAHQKLINKICRDAQTEWNMEQTFQKICLHWKDRVFQLSEFTLHLKEKHTEGIISNVHTARQRSCNDSRFTITGLETHSAEVENDLITLSTILMSGHSDVSRLQLEDWIQSLQEVAKLLDLFERYQQMWAFLTRMFKEKSCCDQRLDLLKLFQPVDETFKELMLSVSHDLHVLNFVSTETKGRFCGSSVCRILTDGLSTMEAIYNQMLDLHHTFCELFPRLWFLNDREVMQLLSFHLTPFTLQPFVRKCFKGVRWLEVDYKTSSNTSDVKICWGSTEQHRQMTVLGVFGSHQEHIAFQPPLEPNPDALVWLRVFEKHLKLTMVKLLKQCAVLRNRFEPLSQDLACNNIVKGIQPCNADRIEDAHPELHLLSEYPLQCVLVVEEALWCSIVLQAFQEKGPMTLRNIKVYNSAKLKNLGNTIRNGVKGSKSESLVSKYSMMCLGALVQLTMNHAQQLSRLVELPCALESSFEWLSLMKYYINTEDQSLQDSENPTCYVEILSHRFQYGFEYSGPEDLVIVHTPSTDKAILGIVLALTSYRCGFVSGPSMSGKTKTVVQLAKAFGQQVVVKQCCPSMRPSDIQQMLLGALQTGAWLLLSSVDLLTQGVQSLLGQLLVDIYQSLSKLERNKNLTPNEQSEYKNAERVTDGTNISEPERHIVLSGKCISARPGYGCVLISSKDFASIPESLRFATRPIVLTRPDCRIIAEVMLTSIGFSEAASLSHRLVSLISLAKDSNCLPDFFPDDHNCILGVLQKIILASEIQLQHAVRQREISDEAKVSAASHTNHMPLENMPVQLHEDRKETVKISKLRSSQLSVIWALMEETALVKAIISVLIPEHKKASEFYIIFKDTFPLACQFPLFQQYIEEGEKIKLENAVKEELQQTCLYCDNEIICNALKLYQAVKISHAVMLIGPSGSGKTACYRALAGALNRLAFQQNECVFENENTIQKNTSQAGPKIFASNWCFIHTLVLFPNAMSHDELFGCFCEKKGWKDGAVAKVLEECDRRCSEICNNEGKSSRTSTVKWLVMDGEPAGKPGWLDYLTTLCTSQDPFLCLSSGKTLPSQSHLNLLMEMTDLQNASPSAVTHCSLVYFMGTELWKAVWKSEINVLSCEHKLDQGIVKMWSRLAEDLFHSTLSLLGQNALTSANHFERGSCKRYGLQEIMSFVRILRAFLQHFVAHLKTHKTTPQTDKRDETNTRGTDTQSKQELLCRNLFLVAYIWGFGGHLHSRHWPQFDLLARQVLFNCRYKIEVPDEESVFEHFDISSKMCSKDTQLTNSIIPKYGKYKRLLSLMLAANQPVLITGEPASGKTTLCKTFLSFDKPHINLPASPLLSSKDLRIILKSICILKNCKDAAGSRRKQPGLLLFVDDLHEAPCDVYGKASMALETLRQSISKGGILTFDTCFFSLLSSGTVSYLTTCCVSGLGNQCSNVISLRLSRLFSIFVLPSHSTDVILSIHSQRLKIWLREMPLNYNSEDMSKCVITATKDLYHAVCGQFQPTALRPHFRFSYHDLQKVFLGMFLSQSDISTTETMHKNQKLQSNPFLALSGPPASVINIIHLWMHECMRTFSDRLCTEDERKTFLSLLVKTATTHFESKLVDNTYLDTFDDPSTVRNQVVHILPVNKTSICQTKVQNVELNNLTEEPKPIGPSDLSQKGHALTESSLESETSSSEDGKTHPLQPTILQLLEDLMAKLVYGPESFETLNSLNQLHKNKSGCCYQEQNLDALLLELCALLDRKEEDKTKRVDSLFAITNRYFVHREAVSQLLHILRALFIPGGHGVLIGSDRGTGRKTTVRLAAYLTGFQLMEVCSDNENKLHEILKEAGNRAIVDGVNVIILVHEEVSPPVREELLVAMAQRAYPALFTEDELQKLVSTVTAVKHSRRYLMDKWMSENNIHVFLLMPFNMSDNSELPANNETQSWIAQMAKALRLSCCVEVYQPWSNLSLVEVAVKCLKICPNKIIQECSEHSLTVAMAGIHQSACQYASAFLRAQPFSPRTYMEFISHFGYLCNQLHEQWQSKTSRVAKALARLEVLNNTAVQCKQHLTQLQTKISKTQQHEKELLRTVEDHKNLLDRALEKYIEKQKHLEEKINQAQQQMKPVFLSYLKIFECLNSSDLEEVRHYRDPPDGVVKIMDALCLLFNRPPGWESAKQLLGQSNFFQELEFFDCSSLTNEQLQQLGQIVQSPHFLSDSVREVSKACESLCRWVQAVYEGCYEQHQLVVKQQIEVLVGEARSQLNLARQHKKEAYQRYEDVNLHLKFVQEDLEEQLLQLREAENQESEAATCAEKLQMHIRDWRAACLEAELRCQNIPGDALILAAVMSYLGPFGPEVRTELLSKWRELCQTGIINKNPKDIRSSLFTQTDIKPISPSLGFPITVTEKLQLPLGQALGLNEWQLEDTLSTRLLVKLLLWGFTCSYTQCWPLLADIEQYLEKTSQNKLITGENEKLEKEFMFGMVVCADDLELLDKLDHAAEKGLKVLVTHVERAIPSPGFLAKLARPSECCFPGLQQPPQLLHPDFCLFLSTHLPVSLLNSAIHASILARVHVVDLSLSSEEIQELMLTQLLQSECRDLLIQHLRFQNNNQVLQEKLVTEEVAVMDYILQSDNFLLKDRYFLSHVAVCQEEIKKLQTEVKQLSEELEHHDSLLAAPRQLMKLAAALYQALQAMSRLSPAYYFSLIGFITVMQEVFRVKGRLLVSDTTGKATKNMLPETMNMMVLQLLVLYRPRLFKRHAVVLKLLVSLALLKYNQLCSEAEILAFLSGFEDTEHIITEACSSSITISHSSGGLPSWIPPHIHSGLLCLEKIPTFRGLIASLCASPTQWHEYLCLPSCTVVGTVPCRSHSHLSLLQRALLWKTILPNSLEELADVIVASQLCLPVKTNWTDFPDTGNIEALSKYLVKYERLVILTLPNPEKDMQMSIQPLYLINQLAHCAKEKNKVQVKIISFGALCDRELILSMLDKAVHDGHWLVLNNCHLLEHWDDEVLARISWLISSFTEEQSPIHPCFRLWFITQENASHFVPAAVRMCALPLVCDSPWDLKEELSCSLRQVMSVSRLQSWSDVTTNNMELLLRCAIFHSILLQRQAYKYLCCGRIHHWSQDDLLALADAHICIASLCNDNTKVLQYIAVNLIHGGHVMDSADLEVVESVAKSCFGTVSSFLGRGPHTLTNVTSSCDRFDLSRPLQVLEPCFQHSTISDPVLLGLSEDVPSEITKINSHNLNLLLKASQPSLGQVKRFSTRQEQFPKLPAYSHTKERLETLKNYLTHKKGSTVKEVESVSHSPIRDFLMAEWDDLTNLVSLLLTKLQQPVQYTMSVSPLFNCTDLSHLEKRADLLSAYLWHGSTSDPPGAYRLSAFKNPRGFLVAVMKEAAQINHRYISDIMLHFQVLCDCTYPALLPPGAVYLCGLELKGASWDSELEALQDTLSPLPVSMPLLCVKAQFRSPDTATDTLSCKSSYLMNKGNVQAAGASPVTPTQLPIYHCPLYVNTEQKSGNWGLTEVNIISVVPLRANLNPVLCSLRRVRLVSIL